MKSRRHTPGNLILLLYTAAALIAFAGNSVLCRLALKEGDIDATGFTIIRLISGALVLALVFKFSPRKTSVTSKGSWLSAAALFGYAAAFSFAYVTLTTGTGALILFGAVQLTMIIAALLSGERLSRTESAGAALAFGGLVYLVFPGLEAPSMTGAMLMAVAGVSWGLYCLRGRNAANPLAETTMNFALSLPFVAILSLFFLRDSHFSLQGTLLAILSGGLASGLGYAIWYAAVRGMSATRASIVQLAVPVLAAIGGIIFLAETISIRLIISSVTVLGGVGLAVAGHKRMLPVRKSG